jgi:hypothetical protein
LKEEKPIEQNIVTLLNLVLLGLSLDSLTTQVVIFVQTHEIKTATTHEEKWVLEKKQYQGS